MAAKQLPIDLKVLRVIAHRHKWMLVALTFVSFAFSAFITRSTVNQYTASMTIFVDPENVLGDIAKGVAVSTSLKDQLATLKHMILSDDFIEPHVIQELNVRISDVYVPPAGLTFTPKVIDTVDTLKNLVKQLFGLEVYTLSNEQKQYMEKKQLAAIIKSNIALRQSRLMFLSISYTGPNQTACKKIVEVLANQCKELLLRSKNTETREALRYIERQYNEITQKLEDLEQELAKMKIENITKGTEAKIALLQRRLDALDALRLIQKNLEELQESKDNLIAEQNNRREALLQGDPEIREKLIKVAKSQEYQRLEAKRAELAALQEIYTDEWPEVIRLKQDVEAMEQTINEDVSEADDIAKERILLADPIYNEYFRQLKQLETNETTLKSQEKNVLDNIEIYESKLKEMPEFEQSFGAIERQINLYSNLQVDLATKRETARATMQLEKTRGENRIRIVNRDFPDTPIGIPPIILMLGLCMVGPGLGGGIIFLLYYLNTSVKSPEDVQVEYNLPVIAIIPRTNFKRELKRHKKFAKTLQKISTPKKRSKKLKGKAHEPQEQLSEEQHSLDVMPSEELMTQEIEHSEVELFDKIIKRIPSPQLSEKGNLSMVTMLTNPESQAAEEYRRLCFNVEWGVKEALSGPCKTIMVTSALPKEGKTITAINLASTLARNHQVLLIDSNFRNPAVHSAFDIPHESGLSDMLENNATPQLFVPPGSPSLSILPAGIGLGHPADLLSSKQMHHFIESVKSSPYFEYAIFDVPPTSQIPDASIIASKLDGIVWVILELGTSKEIVRLALTRVTNPAILGVVLNYSEQRTLPKKYDKIWKDYYRGLKTSKKEARSK